MRINSKLLAAAAALWLGHSAPALAGVNIFACEPEYASLAKELAPNASIYSATTALQDPHQVQARPSLIAKMRQADLALCAGAELEVGWLPMLQMKSANPKVRDGADGMLYAAEQIDTLDKLDKVDRTMGDVHAQGNPHVQFSPARLIKVAEAITERLKRIDASNSTAYDQHLADFQRRWSEAVPRWEAEAATLKGTKVIAYHTSFRYLFDWLGITQVADLEPKPGLPPSSGHLASLLERVRQGDVKAIVVASYQDTRGAEWLAEKSGLPVLVLPMTVGGDDASVDLFRLYDSVIERLKKVN